MDKQEQARLRNIKYREKKKNDEIYKLKNRIRRSRNYKKEYAKKIQEQFNLEDGYHSRNSMLKKVRQIKNNLPENAVKKQQILKELTKDIPAKKEIRVLKNESEVNKTIRDFYLREDVSVILPGKKDTIAVKDRNGHKTIERKRVLVDSKSNLFKSFKKEYPDIKVGQTKFSSLNPPSVLSFLKMPEYSCLCKYHENFKKLFICAKPFLKDSTIGSYEHFVERAVCSVDNFDCMMSICKGCCNFKVTNEFLFPRRIRLTYFQWELIDGQYKEIKHNHTSKEFMEKIKENLFEFKKHFYSAKIQSQKITSDIRTFNTNTVNLIFDFSENFSIQNQNEIQAAYYQRSQVTIFTAVAYFNSYDEEENEKKRSISYAIISDTKNHDKYTACTFIDFLIDSVMNEQDNIHLVNLWSDGAPSHFKSRFSVSNMIRLESKYSTKLRWNFSATSHGKTQADGVGGTIKNMVDRRIKAQNLVISTPFAFFQAAQQICENISIHYISNSFILEQKALLDEFWTNLKNIRDIRQFHCFEVFSHDMISSFHTSLKNNQKLNKMK
ncbi:unnamed protein product [Chironomus riparius]|uniref:Uncharacterized protein n=1 Tax=Chironomus riparius TaxID=315576 RepID=A0A9N9S2D7_9DIPT|nr:unnamed protein product [Chironomus riparius]